MAASQGKLFRNLVSHTEPLQILGTINAYSALLAQKSGARSIYLSGAGVANASLGIPDLGMTNLSEVLEDARRITDVCALPLLVDIDTGWGHAFNIARAIKSMEKAGVAAVHIEDQVIAKRCGHRPNKAIVSMVEMGDRVKAAVDARINRDFVIMARTDAYAQGGMNAVLERAQLCIELGADMIFPEAMTKLEEYHEFCRQIKVPVLANITEFGQTPLLTREELASVGVQLILYPLSAFRAMSQAALSVYQTILKQGTQAEVLSKMQTRSELYEVLGYDAYEKRLDELMKEESNE